NWPTGWLLSPCSTVDGVIPPRSMPSPEPTQRQLERPMRTRVLTVSASIVLIGAATTALACGPGTVALIERMVSTQEPPRYRSGSQFNEMLARAQKKDWKGA